MILHRTLIISAVALLLSNCTSAPEPKLYFLDTPVQPLTDTSSTLRVAIADVSLPAYARKEQIARLSDDYQIALDDDHRWALPPQEAVSIALSKALEAELQSIVVLRPYPRGFSPQVQLRVSFDRFLRGQNGAAEIQGQYLIIEGAREEVSHVERFDINVSGDGSGYQGYMRAVSKALQALSRQIAKDVAS